MCPLLFPARLWVSWRWTGSFSRREEEGGRERERENRWLGSMNQGVWVVWGCEGGVSVAYPSVPFLLGVLVLIVVPSGCWPSLRGGILSFILSRPRASSKLRIFLVGEKPWMAEGYKKHQRGNDQNLDSNFPAPVAANICSKPYSLAFSISLNQTGFLVEFHLISTKVHSISVAQYRWSVNTAHAQGNNDSYCSNTSGTSYNNTTPHTLWTYGNVPKQPGKPDRKRVQTKSKLVRDCSDIQYSSVFLVIRLNREWTLWGEGFIGAFTAIETRSSRVLLHNQISVTMKHLCSFELTIF